MLVMKCSPLCIGFHNNMEIAKKIYFLGYILFLLPCSSFAAKLDRKERFLGTGKTGLTSSSNGEAYESLMKS